MEDGRDARVRQGPIGGHIAGLAIGRQGVVETAVDDGQVAPAEGVLVQLEEGLAHRPSMMAPPAGECPDPSVPLPASNSTSRPFWTRSRFSDCSHTRLLGPSITSEGIS